MTTATDATAARTDELSRRAAAAPEIMLERTSVFDRVLVGVFVAVPLVALIAAVPLPGAGASAGTT